MISQWIPLVKSLLTRCSVFKDQSFSFVIRISAATFIIYHTSLLLVRGFDLFLTNNCLTGETLSPGIKRANINVS